MDRLSKNLAIIIAIIIALVAVIVAFFLTQSRLERNASSSNVSTTTSDISLISTDTSDLISMEVDDNKGSYTILPLSTSADEDVGTLYTIDGMQNENLDTYTLSNVVKYGANPATSKNLGTVSDLSIYGLDTPQATVHVKFANHNNDSTTTSDGADITYDYCVGNPVNGQDASYYICAENSSNVYIASLKPEMLGGKNQYWRKSIISLSPYDYINKANLDAPENGFSVLTIKNQNLKDAAVYQKVAGNTYSLNNAPVMQPNYATLNAIRTNVTELSATKVVAVGVTSKELTEQGFDTPTAQVDFTVNGTDYTLKAVKQSDGTTWHVWRQGIAAIYQVNESDIADWAVSNIYTLADPTLYSLPTYDFSKIDITNGDAKNTINIARTIDDSKSTEKTPYYFYHATKSDGTDISDNTYQSFISTLAVLSVDAAYNKDAPTGTPDYSFSLTHYNTNRVDSFSFYKTDNGYIAVVNGVVRGVVLSQNFQNSIDAIIHI